MIVHLTGGWSQQLERLLFEERHVAHVEVCLSVHPEQERMMTRRQISGILMLAVVTPAGLAAEPQPNRPASKTTVANESENPLSAYPQSEHFLKTVAWHNEVGENEIRTSWFLHGHAGVAMVCSAKLTKYEVATAREVWGRATQSRKVRELSHAQVLTLRKIAIQLPNSAEMPQLEDLVLVSISHDGKPKTYLYDRLHLPPEIIRAYDLTGDYILTEPRN